MQKKNFNQSKNLIYASYLFVISSTLFAWNKVYVGSLEGFSIPSLLAILAFGFMWVHYLSGYLKSNFEPELDSSKSLKITQYFVLIAILAHPIVIISYLNSNGFGLPPSSFKNYLGTTGQLFISLGSISLVIFLLFEFKNILKKRPKLWENVLRLNDLAMLLIIVHGFKLGFVINSGWFRYVWLAYGLTLLFFYYDKYVNKKRLSKFVEVFIITLVLIALGLIGLASTGDTRVKYNPVNSSSVTSDLIQNNSQTDDKTISIEELAQNNGLNNKKCFVAVDGIVYDATNSPEWENGQHTPSRGQAKCGEDLTSQILQSPHGKSVLIDLQKVGKLSS